MFVVRFGINGENTDYYFNSIRNARLFERKILMIVYNDIEKNQERVAQKNREEINKYIIVKIYFQKLKLSESFGGEIAARATPFQE